MQVKDIFIGIAFTIISLTNYSIAQAVFSEKFEGCKTYDFAFESDTTNAKKNSIALIRDLKLHLGVDTVGKMRGVLQLQIIVDVDGKSCLLSLDNKTNIDTEDLNLKSWVDEQVTWGAPTEKIAVMVYLKFADLGIECRRVGSNEDKGWHYLRD